MACLRDSHQFYRFVRVGVLQCSPQSRATPIPIRSSIMPKVFLRDFLRSPSMGLAEFFLTPTTGHSEGKSLRRWAGSVLNLSLWPTTLASYPHRFYLTLRIVPVRTPSTTRKIFSIGQVHLTLFLVFGFKLCGDCICQAPGDHFYS